MKVLFTIGLFFISLYTNAQVDSVGLKLALQKLDKALVQRNETDLQFLLHRSVSYGHSNGWVQNKADIMNDFKRGKLQYDRIVSSAASILDITKNRATVIMNSDAEGLVNGNTFNLKMHVLHVWLKTKQGWQLYVRQSAKL